VSRRPLPPYARNDHTDLPLYPFLTHRRRIKPLCRPGFHCLLFYLQSQRTEKEREGD